MREEQNRTDYWQHQILPEQFFPVPGYYGGFNFCLVKPPHSEVFLLSSSFCRIAGGSHEIHRVTPDGIFVLCREYDIDPKRHKFPGTKMEWEENKN